MAEEKGIEKRHEARPSLTPVRPRDMISQWEHEMDRMFEDFWRRPFLGPFGPRWRHRHELAVQEPVMDLYEDKDNIVVKAELPGLDKNDIEVNITGNTLTLKGEKRKEEAVRDEDYYFSERNYGSFVRTMDLPSDIVPEQVKANFKNGVLEIRMPKTPEAKSKSRQIKIE